MMRNAKRVIVRDMMDTSTSIAFKCGLLKIDKDFGLISNDEDRMLLRFAWLNHGLTFSNATDKIPIIPIIQRRV